MNHVLTRAHTHTQTMAILFAVLEFVTYFGVYTPISSVMLLQYLQVLTVRQKCQNESCERAKYNLSPYLAVQFLSANKEKNPIRIISLIDSSQDEGFSNSGSIKANFPEDHYLHEHIISYKLLQLIKMQKDKIVFAFLRTHQRKYW